MKEFNSTEQLVENVGQSLGVSPWYRLEQSAINDFAKATNDYQAIHLDAEIARQAGFAGPIAHGYLLLSLVPYLAGQTYRVHGITTKINYGLERCRFISPVIAGSEVRAEFVLAELTKTVNGTQLITDITLHIAGTSKPAMIARTLALLTENQEK